MPRLGAGPCLSVILPARSSIFLTSPLMALSYAVAAPIDRLGQNSRLRRCTLHA